ncbi:MAG: hypothetical protein NZ775_08645 [Gammaproteobacteria bacterium]|nr:hypothetical protein [Gammaproteobacteria bacterium]
MKKLIALAAVTAMASSTAMAAVSLSGSASVTYDDNGTADSATTYSSTLTVAGSSGATSASATINLLDGSAGSASLTTSIGPVTITADMTNDTEATGSQVDETGVTLSLDVLAGDISIALDDAGTVTVSSTVAGIAITHVLSGTTKASATLAGMDVNIARTALGVTTWDVSTTLNGVTLKIDNAGAVTASMGLAGNTVTITNAGDTTVSVSRDLTSGASLTATYDTTDDALTLKAAVSF